MILFLLQNRFNVSKNVDKKKNSAIFFYEFTLIVQSLQSSVPIVWVIGCYSNLFCGNRCYTKISILQLGAIIVVTRVKSLPESIHHHRLNLYKD